MTHLSLKKWSGAFEIPGVVEKIRRIIQARVNHGECVCVCDDGAKGITPEVRLALERDFPADKVRFSRVHPVAHVVISTRRDRFKRSKGTFGGVANENF